MSESKDLQQNSLRDGTGNFFGGTGKRKDGIGKLWAGAGEGRRDAGSGHYLIVEDAELEAIEIESTHTIEIDSFVV